MCAPTPRFAEPAGEGLYRITGHKWFMSAPMCDAFLVLAQMSHGNETGLGCFLLPRLLPDGRGNGFRFQRLKDKLGNRSNASSEVEFHGALRPIGRRAGQGRLDHHRHGDADAARLRRLLRRR